MENLKLASLNVKNLKTDCLYVSNLRKTNYICYLTETWLNEGEVNQFESIFNECNLFLQSDVSIEDSYQLRGRPFRGKCWLLGKQ